MSCDCIHQVIAEGTFKILAQLKTSDGSFVLQEDVDTILFTLTDTTEAEAVEGEPVNVEAADAVFDTLQTGSVWTRDSVGYNFSYKTAVPEEDHSYKLKVVITLLNGDVLVIKTKVNAI